MSENRRKEEDSSGPRKLWSSKLDLPAVLSSPDQLRAMSARLQSAAYGAAMDLEVARGQEQTARDVQREAQGKLSRLLTRLSSHLPGKLLPCLPPLAHDYRCLTTPLATEERRESDSLTSSFSAKVSNLRRLRRQHGFLGLVRAYHTAINGKRGEWEAFGLSLSYLSKALDRFGSTRFTVSRRLSPFLLLRNQVILLLLLFLLLVLLLLLCGRLPSSMTVATAPVLCALSWPKISTPLDWASAGPSPGWSPRATRR